MPHSLFDPCEGPIPGLRLPLNAWKALQRENITTLDQLKAAADEIERFEGIGRKTAQAIRAELTRLEALEGQISDKDQPQGSSAEAQGLTAMTDRKAPDPRSAETLIEEAHNARVLAHVRAMLSRLKPRSSKPRGAE